MHRERCEESNAPGRVCRCGREHPRMDGDVLIGAGAAGEVSRIAREGNLGEKVLVVSDRNTHPACGEEVERVLAGEGFRVHSVVLGRNIHPDPGEVFNILEPMGPPDAFVACGSGTITDLTRFVSSRTGRPFLVVASAPSMDGYASSVTSITVKGVKKTYPARPPVAVVADLDVLRAAPGRMIRAGFGDLLGKITSLLDWELGRILNDDYYCPEVARRVRRLLERMLDHVGPLIRGEDAGLRSLIGGLVESGLAIRMVGTSRPASGCEHHFSHFLDLYGLLHGKDVPLHGTKVGLGTYYVSRLYRRFMDLDLSAVRVPPEDRPARGRRVREGYQGRADMVLEVLEGRDEPGSECLEKRLRGRRDELGAVFEDFRPLLEGVEGYLRAAGLHPGRVADGLPEGWVPRALRYGFEIRDRFTLCALLYRMGLLDAWVEEMV